MQVFNEPLNLNDEEIQNLPIADWENFRISPEEDVDPSTASTCMMTPLGSAPEAVCKCSKPDGTVFEKTTKCQWRVCRDTAGQIVSKKKYCENCVSVCNKS